MPFHSTEGCHSPLSSGLKAAQGKVESGIREIDAKNFVFKGPGIEAKALCWMVGTGFAERVRKRRSGERLVWEEGFGVTEGQCLDILIFWGIWEL